MGEIARLEENITLPLPEFGQEIDSEYMRILVGEIERRLGPETNATVNLQSDRIGNTDVIYYGGIPDQNGVFPDGTWRIRKNSSGESSKEKKVSGTWTPVVVDDA